MISWRDEALILNYQRHGEANAVLEVLTQNKGRYRGLVRGGGSRKQAPQLQPGAIATVEFGARLEEQLGTFRVESHRSFVTHLIGDPKRLAGFQSLASLVRFSMEERDPHPRLYQASLAVLDADECLEGFLRAYLDWEVVLLSEAGFHLDLERCVVTGQSADLAYISPKSGRAVSREAAGEWADRLLPFSPAFVDEDATAAEIIAALKVTEFFLTEWLAQMIGKAKLPEARARFMARIEAVAPK